MVDFDKLKEEQLKLAKKVVLKDSFDRIGLVGGVDQAYNNEDVVSAIVVCDYATMEVKERVFAVARAKVLYLKGFLAYREGPAVSEAYSRLKTTPDVILFDGNGILHPRGCGIASHIGVLLGQASIGVAKHLLVGEVKGNIVYLGKEALAQAVATREHSKPIYVSPGNKVSLKTSVEIVRNCIRPPHKLPEPLHLAHRYAGEVREKIARGMPETEIRKEP